MKKNAQISMEFLVIFGIGFTLMIIFAGLFFSVSSQQKSELGNKQIKKILSDLKTEGEGIYFRGIGNKISYKANFPEGIVNFSIVQINSGGTVYSYFNISHFEKNGVNEYYSDLTLENISFFCDPQQCNSILTPERNVYWFNDRNFFNSGNKIISIETKKDGVMFSFER